jgi:hypothetical protein
LLACLAARLDWSLAWYFDWWWLSTVPFSFWLSTCITVLVEFLLLLLLAGIKRRIEREKKERKKEEM